MSSRPLIAPHKVLDDQSLATSFTSEVTIVSNVPTLSYDISWAGTAPVGTMEVQVSNTYTINGDGSVRDPGVWRTLPSMSAAVSGNTGEGGVDIYVTGFYAVRLAYTATSGTGTMDATVVAKVL